MQRTTEGYDTALICLNGHDINSSFTRFPEFNAKHCKDCGKAGITECPSCDASIRGRYAGSMALS
jgi:hypothetical protein